METSARTDNVLLAIVIAICLGLAVLVAFKFAAGPAAAVGDSDSGHHDLAAPSTTSSEPPPTTSAGSTSSTTMAPSSSTSSLPPTPTSVSVGDHYDWQINCVKGTNWLVVAFRTTDWTPPVMVGIDVDGFPAAHDINITDDNLGTLLLELTPGEHWIAPHLHGRFLPGVTVNADCAQPAVPVVLPDDEISFTG